MSVSVIIPSADGSRHGNVDRLKYALETQTLRPCEVIVIKGVSPSGLARNKGARRASGDVLVFLDDDAELGHRKVIEGMAGLLEDGEIGMVGAAQLLPPDSSSFQRAAGHQIPRSQSAVVDVLTDSDMVTTGCCAMRRKVFFDLGGFNEQIPRGVDPEMRYRVRRRGLKIVVAPRVWYYHPMPANWNELCRMYFRNGQQSAEATWRIPGAALDNPDGHSVPSGVHRSAPYRVCRHIGRFLLRLLMFRWIALVSQASYVAGYAWRWSHLCRDRSCGRSLRSAREVSKS